MASEIRVNSLTSRTGLGTVTFEDSGPVISGVVTITSATVGELTGNTAVFSGNVSAGIVTASGFTGPLDGNVTGNLTGEVNSISFDTNANGVVVTGVVTATSGLNVGSGGTIITTGSKGFVGINSVTPSLHQLEIVSGSDDPALMLYRRRNTGGGVVFQCFDDVNSTKRTILQLTTNGSLVLPQQISWLAGKNAGTTVSSTDINSPNIISYNEEVFDVGSNYNSTTSRFTAPVAGKYFYSITLNSGNDFANTFIIGILKNGGYYERTRLFDINAHRKTYSVSGVVDLSTNDYLEVGAYVNTGTLSVDNFGMFCGYLLG